MLGPKTAIFAPEYAFLGTYHVGQFTKNRENGQNVALKMLSAWSYVAHLEPKLELFEVDDIGDDGDDDLGHHYLQNFKQL